MRKLFGLLLAGAAAWWFVGRRDRESSPAVTIGYEDGSSVTLEEGSPHLDRLLQIAAEAGS